jgi:hypothetical protein
MGIAARVKGLLHHYRLALRNCPESNGTRYQDYALLRSGEEAGIRARFGNLWLLHGRAHVTSQDIERITYRGDWGYD